MCRRRGASRRLSGGMTVVRPRPRDRVERAFGVLTRLGSGTGFSHVRRRGARASARAAQPLSREPLSRFAASRSAGQPVSRRKWIDDRGCGLRPRSDAHQLRAGWEEVRRDFVATMAAVGPDAQRRLMGMNTPEFARYLSADLAAGPPRARSRRRSSGDGRPLRAPPPAHAGRDRGRARMEDRWPLGLASSCSPVLIQTC